MGSQRLWTVILKVLGRIQSLGLTLSVRLQVERMGRGCRVMPDVIISGGKNIRIGAGVYLGRGVVLDASQGRIDIGSGCEIRDGARFYARSLVLGQKVTVGEGTLLNGDIRIGDEAWLARGCDLSGEVTVEKAILGPYTICAAGAGHHKDSETGAYTMRGADSGDSLTSVLIRAGAWTGVRAIILKGVTIESGTVVAAGAVVTKNFPEGSVLAGVPARPIPAKEDC